MIRLAYPLAAASLLAFTVWSVCAPAFAAVSAALASIN